MSQTNQSLTEPDTITELKALVAQLEARLQRLEEHAALWHPEVTEDVLLAISAACAAYLGKRATIKQVHLRRGSTWASQGRAVVQQSHAGMHATRTGRPNRRQTPNKG